jgi:predicted RNA-binding Zn ribbon-like protein
LVVNFVDLRDVPVGDRPSAAGFWLHGGHVALDLVNTVLVANGELVDRLTSPEELGRWTSVTSLGARYGAPAEVDAQVFAQVIGLRGALKAGFDAIVAQERLPAAPLATINAILRSGPGSELRSEVGGGVSYGLRVDLARDSGPLPWLLADAAASLISGDDAGLLRRCANHDSCVLLFLDTSRSHTRRWCSMEMCGNRSKVAAFNARSRQAGNR